MAIDDGLIEWCDPPEVARNSPRNHPWAVVAALLRERPYRWACIDRSSSMEVAPRVRNGVAFWSPPGSFEATTRLVDGRICTWARYVGLANPPGSPRRECYLTEAPNPRGCHDPQCTKLTWEHDCPVGPCEAPEHSH